VTDDVRDTAGVADETDSDAPETATEAEDSVAEKTVDEKTVDEKTVDEKTVDDETVDDETFDDEAEVDSPEPVERRRLRLPPRLRRIASVVLVLLLLISGGLATWLYFKQYRPDQQTDARVARTVVSAATDGTTALLTYSYDSLDKDFAAARTHLGGDFLTYYDTFTGQSAGPLAQQKSIKATGKVTGAALSELHPDWAVVLVFADQVTTTKDSPLPSVAVSTALVHMTRINGTWLITKFDPL
jgi:Mce-associated membrane protein